MLEKILDKVNDAITPTIDSKELFKEGISIRIRHGNDVYILRITKTNKLILTK
ncbi:MAG: hemin uptake protein HemP [Campylobacterales bacterium]|nr:hemin uptake protein HemP [Campylobacterales bacterium]